MCGIITFYAVYSDTSRTVFLDGVASYLDTTVVTTSKHYGTDYTEIWDKIYNETNGEHFTTQ